MNLVSEGVNAGYGKVGILRDVSFRIGQGECVALLGKNGMGKTTLLKTIMGMADLHDGNIEILGQNVTRSTTHHIVRLGVSYVAQDEPVFGDLTVEENLRLGGLYVKDYARARAEIVEIFPRLGERPRQKAGTLSGGERKMLMIGRALISRPHLVLLDEVTEGLQPSVRDLVTEQLGLYRERVGASIFLVEQNIDFALKTASRFLVLSGGRIVDQGDVGDATAVANIEQHMTL